uniref:Uncharacterized protein n=1 Tax=Tanacetum cinerariifolium TaxID=118510 RepID=A0A6L2LWE6_TANCI|nr:hypothetical protein [Tanacetum cinerariifolium]
MKIAEVLQRKTYEPANKALGIIAEALSISCYSKKLFNMKEWLSLSWVSIMRWFNNVSKHWIHPKIILQLELKMALDTIDKHEQLRPAADKTVDSEDSLSSLVVTIRELLQ